MGSVKLSTRSSLIEPSPTLAITARAKALRAEGRRIFTFAAGEPDFNTPEVICEAAIEAIRSGFTKYTPSAGIPELRKAVADDLKRRYGMSVEPSQVIVSCGAKHSTYNTFMCLLEPGDEVIVFAPYWPTYIDQIKLAGGVPVVVDTTHNPRFEPDIDAVRMAITGKTKAILVNSPCNPTGAVFSRQTLKALAMEALRKDLWLISDEIYERLIYDGEHHPMAALSKEVAERTVTIMGCSKSYAMTGWRIGFSVAPKELASAMSAFQDQVTSNPTSFAQKGALAALAMNDSQLATMRETFRTRRDCILGSLRDSLGLNVPAPEGAFYVFANIKQFLSSGETDTDLAKDLLEQAGVATIPGTCFGAGGHLRFTYACSENEIREGIEALRQFLDRRSA